MKKTKKADLLIPLDNLYDIQELEDDEKVKLLDAVVSFHLSGELTYFTSKAERHLKSIYLDIISRDYSNKVNFENTCIKNSINKKNWWNKKNGIEEEETPELESISQKDVKEILRKMLNNNYTNVYECIQTNTNVYECIQTNTNVNERIRIRNKEERIENIEKGKMKNECEKEEEAEKEKRSAEGKGENPAHATTTAETVESGGSGGSITEEELRRIFSDKVII